MTRDERLLREEGFVPLGQGNPFHAGPERYEVVSLRGQFWVRVIKEDS